MVSLDAEPPLLGSLRLAASLREASGLPEPVGRALGASDSARFPTRGDSPQPAYNPEFDRAMCIFHEIPAPILCFVHNCRYACGQRIAGASMRGHEWPSQTLNGFSSCMVLAWPSN